MLSPHWIMRKKFAHLFISFDVVVLRVARELYLGVPPYIAPNGCGVSHHRLLCVWLYLGDGKRKEKRKRRGRIFLFMCLDMDKKKRR